MRRTLSTKNVRAAIAHNSMLKLAAKIGRRLESDYAEFVADCESYRADGYRPHYCEHNTNLWTDYDNICGGCEDGVTMSDGVQRRTEAIRQAKAILAEQTELFAALETLARPGIRMKMSASAYSEMHTAVVNFAVSRLDIEGTVNL